MFFRTMKLATRSIIGFGLIGLVVLMLGLFSLAMVQKMSEQSEAIEEIWVEGINRLAQLSKTEDRAGIMTFRMVVLRDPNVLAANQTALMQVLESVRQQQKDFVAYLHDTSEREIFERYLQASKAVRQEQLEIIRFAAQGQLQAAIGVLNGPVDQYAIELGTSSGQLMDFYLKHYHQAAEIEQQTREQVITAVITAIVLAALLTVLLATPRSILQPVLNALGIAQTIARGDLTSTINDIGKGEPALLLQALNAMQVNLRNMVLHIKGSSALLVSSSGQ